MPTDSIGRLGDQISFLFVGPHQLLVHLHLDLVPRATQEWLTIKEIRYDPDGLNFPCYPLPDQDVNIVLLYRLCLYTGKFYPKAPEGVDVEDDGKAKQSSCGRRVAQACLDVSVRHRS